MNYFLDAGGAGLIFIAYGLIILFILLAIVLESIVMMLLKYNTRFLKAFRDSFLVNIASLAAGFVLLKLFYDFFSYYSLINIAILYGLSVLIEGFLLQVLNKDRPLTRTFLVCLLMNIVSYALLYAIVNSGK